MQHPTSYSLPLINAIIIIIINEYDYSKSQWFCLKFGRLLRLEFRIVKHVSSPYADIPERHLLVDLQRLELFQHQQRVELLGSL